MEGYLDEYFSLIQEYLENKIFLDRIRGRFSTLEEGMARILISNYKEKKEANLFEPSKTKFKDDIDYAISELSPSQIQTFAEIFRVYSNFNLFSKKLMMITQLLLSKYSEKMGGEIYNYMFSLAHVKTGLKAIENSLVERVICNDSKNYQ